MEKEKVQTASADNGALTARIIADGKAEAKKIVSDAEAYAEKAIKDAEAVATEIISSEKSSALRASEEILAGKRTLSALEEKKTILNAKQELVETVYIRARSKLLKMTKKEFLDFSERLISRHAEKGDEVVIDKSSPASAEEVASLPSVSALSLKVEVGEVKGGGIILSGKTCDKDLSFKALLEIVKEKTEAEIASELF